MKYLDEFRDGDVARRIAGDIARLVTRRWAIMEVCGGQTHAIIRNGIDQILPPEVELIHGPGCPVCVTPLEVIDQALASGKVRLTEFAELNPGFDQDGRTARIVVRLIERIARGAWAAGSENE